MNPCETLESLRHAYATDDWDGIGSDASDLLHWIKEGEVGDPMPNLTEPQLSALLIMARGYSRNKVVEQGNWMNSKRKGK